MRLTVLDDHLGRNIQVGRERYRIYLNDVEVKHVFIADDIDGEVIAAVTDSNGCMIAENGEVKRQTLRGKVRIVPL
ncbi:MAG TPA: hypothetical protein VJY31_16420 [Buttiauxella sp.]|nr:hypothetical protein [Buttiauxella sp.]